MSRSLTLSLDRNTRPPRAERRDGASPEAPDAVLEAARAGDSAAFGDLVQRHQARVYRLAGRFFRRPEDVDDIAQEVFLRAWDKLPTFRGEAPFEHWLTRLCLNLCYQRLRRSPPPLVPIEEASLDAADLVDGRRSCPEARLDVERWLARLDPRDRFILLLLDGEGWSTAEIAERLGWSRVNVKVRAHRARKRLRHWLEGDC